MRLDEIIKEIAERTGWNVTKGREVYKNSVLKTSIEIRVNKTDKKGIVVYAEDILNEPIDKVVDGIIKAEKSMNRLVPDSVEKFRDFKNVKDKLYMCVRKKTDDDTLAKIDLLDMEIYFRVIISKGSTSFAVRKDLLGWWNMTVEDLREIASQNTKYSVQNMEDLVLRLMADKGNDYSEGFPEEKSQMMVITNTMGVNGAGCIADTEFIKKFSEWYGEDFLLLPISIHEVIIVPKGLIDIKDAREMVESINGSNVAEQDRLTDNVYTFVNGKLAFAE